MIRLAGGTAPTLVAALALALFPHAAIAQSGRIPTGGTPSARQGAFPAWTSKSSGTLRTLRAVAFTAQGIAVAVGDTGTIIRSTDGGDTWGRITSPAVDDLRGVAFHGETGLIVGFSGAVLRSTNGGADWVKLARPTAKFLFAVGMSPSAAVAVGEEGTLLHSSDDGATWSPSTAGVANIFMSVALWADTVIAGAYAGPVAISLSGGSAWGVEVLGNPPNNAPAFYGVSFATSRTAIMVGQFTGPSVGPLILRTDNMGFTWIRQTNPPVGALRSVAFIGPNAGYIVGDGGSILASVDTGDTWTEQPSGVTAGLNGVAFSDAAHGLAVGDSGTVLQAAPQGVTGIADPGVRAQAPGEGYRVSQNYPNPFNPSTRIQFHLAGPTAVSLKVFDVSGREIATLVDGFQHGGDHEVTFDASLLASGPYFYRMAAGGHVSTGRMLLVK